MAATVDYLFGYDATAGVVDDWMYEQLAASYVFDEQVSEFLRQSNPWALRGHRRAAAGGGRPRAVGRAAGRTSSDRLQAAYLELEGELERARAAAVDRAMRHERR